MKVVIMGDEPGFTGVKRVQLPGIYPKGSPLPERMSLLCTTAALSIARACRHILDEGGSLFLSDCFRSRNEQLKAHKDWLEGRKTAYSPPPGFSVHEAARAIDIDTADTIIGHGKVREILVEHGWTPITSRLYGAESWHYEFRGSWEKTRVEEGYRAMVRGMLAMIGNLPEINRNDSEAVGRIQKALFLPQDGIYGPRTFDAVRAFQSRRGLQPDGIAGPITRGVLGI